MTNALDEQFADLRLCRFCGELLAPMYGAVKPYPSGSIFSPATVRKIADGLAGADQATYFECYECESRRRRKKVWFYSGLGALVLAAWLFGAIGSGTLRLPW